MRGRAIRALLLTLFTMIVLAGLATLLGKASRTVEAGHVSFHDDDGPLDAQLRMLCFRQPTVLPFADLLVDVEEGEPIPGTPLPADCNYLVALRPWPSPPSGKRDGPAYTLYSTSWQPADPPPLPAEAKGIIYLDDEQPLTLFHVVASVGWEPAPDSIGLTGAGVRAALQQMSAALYDWTEGRMAIGPVSVHTGGKRWSEADIRFLPANDFRPAAFVGGMVPAPTTYSAPFTDVTYSPASIFAGRSWDGEEASRGPWTAPNGYLTLGHEWAHYALFLYDEYQQSEATNHYCVCDTLNLPAGCGYGERDGSVMAYFYLDAEGGATGSEFWHPDTHTITDTTCFDSWQGRLHGGSDWETLAYWHSIQGLSPPFAPLDNPPVADLEGGPPLGLAFYLFGREPGHRILLPLMGEAGAPRPAPQEPTIAVQVESVPPPTETLPTQVYLLKGDGSQATILPQGSVQGPPSSGNMGQITLLGVESGDRLRLFADQYNRGDRSRYTLVTDSGPADVTLVQNPFTYTLEHTFAVTDGQPLSLTLSLLDEANELGAPAMQVCDLDEATPCWEAQMTLSGDWWQASISAREPSGLPRYLLARIVDAADPDNVAKEVVQWIQMAGGVGPGHKDGMAPLLDGIASLNAGQPLQAGDCNVVSFMPAADAGARAASLGTFRVAGQPLDIFARVATAGDCPDIHPGEDLSVPALYLTLAYSQDVVDQLGIGEADLVIIHYDRVTSAWEEVDEISQDENLNWIAAQIYEDGIYAIGYEP